MEIVIVTGMSGAGKTQTANVLEDIGYYCIDNMPPLLMVQFAELVEKTGQYNKIALVTDVRSGEFFKGFVGAVNELRSKDISLKILFLDAADDILAKRYSATRRKHPLLSPSIKTLSDAIAYERTLLFPIRDISDYIIDTSFLTNAQLKDTVSDVFLSNKNDTMSVQCISFGYKHGIPSEADLVFDVRFLPNPYYVDELKDKSGLDSKVFDYVLDNSESQDFIDRLLELLDYLIPRYKKEGKSRLVIAVGCTGGRHRSVAVAQLINEHIKSAGFSSNITHRDLDKAYWS